MHTMPRTVAMKVKMVARIVLRTGSEDEDGIGSAPEVELCVCVCSKHNGQIGNGLHTYMYIPCTLYYPLDDSAIISKSCF